MSEEKFGGAGLEQAQGYTRMVDPTPEPAAVPDYDDARAAAEELTRKREAETPIITRDYFKVDGPDAGLPAAENETIDIKRAAKDLSEIREREHAEAQAERDRALAEEVDNLRNPQAQQQPQQPNGQQQPEQQQQPESVQAQPELPPDAGVDPELVAALNNPKVRAPLEAVLTQAEQSRQVAEQTRAQYAQAVGEAAQVAAAAVVAQFPELSGLTGEQLPVALNLVKNQNPQRHAEIISHLNRVQGLHNAAQQAQAQQAQVANAHLQRWTEEQDRIFEDSVKDVPREHRTNIEKNLLRVAKDVYGVSKEEFVQAWQTNPLLRSAPIQRMLMDAVSYQLAREGIRNSPPPPAPPVQKPGVSSQGLYDDSEIKTLEKRFATTGSEKDAARLLLAKRAAKAERG